jgi:type IV pilus assembly protein PilM
MAERRMIGLDIGSGSVRAAEVTMCHGRLCLHNFGQVALPVGAVEGGAVLEAAAVTLAIQRLWKERKFASRDVVLGTASQRVVVRAIDLQWVAPHDLQASLPYLVGDILPLPVAETVLDFLPLGDGPQPQGKPIHGLLVASPRDTVTAMVRCAEAAGLRPLAVDLAAFALLRAVGRGRGADPTEKIDDRRKPGPPTEVLIDIGATVTNIVVHRGGVPQIVRIVPRGGADITTIIADRFGISTAEAEDLKRRTGMVGERTDIAELVSLAVTPLLEELRGSLDYYTSTHAGARVERVRMCGGGSLLRGLMDAVHTELGLHTERADPLLELHVEDDAIGVDEVELYRFLAAVPIGLAMSAA